MTIAETEPVRAIRNSLERLRIVSEGTPVADHVVEERAIIEEALRALEPEASTRADNPDPRHD